MNPFQTFKLMLADATGLAKDALHIYVALAVWLGACLLFGWRARSWKPLVLVALFALGAEAIDMRDSLALEGRLFLAGNLHDLWNSMLAPLLIFLAARYTPVFREDKPPRGSGD